MSADRRNDEFALELETHRRAITAHCYRMLGSFWDADDIAQDSITRAWYHRNELRTNTALRAWIYKIATHACLNKLKAEKRRGLPHTVTRPSSPSASIGPAHEGLWIEPAPDALLDVPDDEERGPEGQVTLRESVGLAFLAALQHLSPKQRAVLLLVDVLGWRPLEAAKLLETSVASVNSLLQRARSSVATREAFSARSAKEEAPLLQRYIATWESGDLDAFAELLADDVILSMPPQLEWFAGKVNVLAFLTRTVPRWPGQYLLVPVQANGAPAVIAYRQETAASAHEATAIMVLSVRDAKISSIVRFSSEPRLRALLEAEGDILGV